MYRFKAQQSFYSLSFLTIVWLPASGARSRIRTQYPHIMSRPCLLCLSQPISIKFPECYLNVLYLWCGIIIKTGMLNGPCSVDEHVRGRFCFAWLIGQKWNENEAQFGNENKAHLRVVKGSTVQLMIFLFHFPHEGKIKWLFF